MPAKQYCAQVRDENLDYRGESWHDLRYFNADLGTFAFTAADLHHKIGAIKNFQPFVNVADADAFHINLRHTHFRNSHAVILDFNREPSINQRGADADVPALELPSQ